MKKSGSTFFVVAISFFLAGCSPVASPDNNESSSQVVLGTIECCNVLDPANTYKSSEWMVMQQLYPSLISVQPDSNELALDIASRAEFISPTTFRIEVKPGLTFSNGNDLNASDAVFSLERQMIIQSPNGPTPLLKNIDSVTLVNNQTLDINLKSENDVTIKRVLSSVLGLVVDEEVFSKTEIMTNGEILAANSFAGPYVLDAFEEGALVSLRPNSSYEGLWGSPKNAGVVIRGYQDPMNMVADYNRGVLDGYLIHRASLQSSVITAAQDSGAKIIGSPTVDAISLVLNHATLPFGTSQSVRDSDKARAVRQALAVLVDREEINDFAFFGTHTPSPSVVPSDFDFSIGDELLGLLPETAESRRELAKEILLEKKIQTPIALTIMTSSGRFGDLGIRLSTILKEQFDRSGLFEIKILDVEWQERTDRRLAGNYELMVQMWSIDFGDADNLISAQATSASIFNNGYFNPEVDRLSSLQASTLEPEKRRQLLNELQVILNEDLPYIPLVSGGPTLVASPNLQGGELLIHRENKFMFVALSK